jgi:hypothetical protein
VKDKLVALIGELENATPSDVMAARRELRAMSNDMAHGRYTRRLAAALAAVCSEALKP